MQNNLFFLSGPHGAGKSTLERELKKEDPAIVVPELFSRTVKFDTDPKYRKVLKNCERAIESYEYLQIAKQNPDNLVLGNRCVYDVIAYDLVYRELGWISPTCYEACVALTTEMFREENTEPNVIVLNPGFQVVQEHLWRRWSEKEKKWRESDLDYAKAATLAYENFRGRRNVLYIDHQVNFEDRSEIRRIIEWMKGQKVEEQRSNQLLLSLGS